MTPEPPPAAAPARRPLRVLIADDNSINQIILGEQLAGLGHSYVAVANGRDALTALKDSPWDAILLDCQMPVMDGFETVAEIRRAEAAGAPRTWVVAITASSIDGEREGCLRAGMDDFLSKPFRVSQLIEVIARIPVSAETAGHAVDPALVAGLAGSKASTGENLLDRMYKLFTGSGPELLETMEQALRHNDYAEAMRAVHKLAGGCGYFGANELYATCTEFERLGRANDQAGLRALAPRVRHEYARVTQALEAL
jgi:CheY-like chemotaxis protein